VSLVLIQDRALGTTTYFTNGNALRRSLQTDSGYIAVIAVDTAGTSATPSQVTSNFASGLQTDPTGPLAGVTLGVNSVAQPGVAAPPAAALSNNGASSNTAVIGGAIGGTVAALVVLIVIAAIIIVVNKKVRAIYCFAIAFSSLRLCVNLLPLCPFTLQHADSKAAARRSSMSAAAADSTSPPSAAPSTEVAPSDVAFA
jgi:hypothetical protein